MYSFTFVVGDADAQSEDFEDRFFEAGCDDATLSLMHGAVAVCFDREASCYKDAVMSAYEDVLSTNSRLLRFEPDFLVSAAEIANRAGLSRAAVSLYEKGERGSNFPKPYARITTASPLWDWVEVSRWLCVNQKLDVSEFRDAQVARLVNFGVQLHEPFVVTNAKLDNALLEPLAA